MPFSMSSDVSLKSIILALFEFRIFSTSLTDKYGNTISWASSGMVGFKGSRKNTPFAAAQAAEKAATDGISRGLTTIEVMIKGPGGGREAAVRALMASGLKVTGIMDLTPIPHNGCRPSKKRRV